MKVRGFRVYVTVESDGHVTEYTGGIVKAFIYSLNKDLRMFHGMKGVISYVHISPLFTPSRGDFTLGDLKSPVVIVKNGEKRLVPISLTGEEYVFHVGGDKSIIESVMRSVESIGNTPLKIKYRDNILTFKVESVKDVTRDVMDKDLGNSRVTVYLKSPTILFNVLTPTRLPKFNISSYEVLMTGYMFWKGNLTLTHQDVIESMGTLGLLVETYYSIKTVHTIFIPYKAIEPAIIGKITYIVDTDKPNERDKIKNILSTSEIVGIGRSRQNGFGTITWVGK